MRQILTRNISELEHGEIIAKLRDDEHYYGAYGKQFISSSDVDCLINNPASFGEPDEDNLAFLMGRYFHASLIEQDKVDTFITVDVTTRNTKAYKEALDVSGQQIIMLESEKQMMDTIAAKIKAHPDFYNEIYQDGAKYEEPGIIQIDGVWFKGKTDILLSDKMINLKTTADINKFRRNAYIYNYDASAWVYEQIFKVPQWYFVADKNTGMLGIFTCSQSFLQSGKDKVERALENYRTYLGTDAVAQPEWFYLTGTL